MKQLECYLTSNGNYAVFNLLDCVFYSPTQKSIVSTGHIDDWDWLKTEAPKMDFSSIVGDNNQIYWAQLEHSTLLLNGKPFFKVGNEWLTYLPLGRTTIYRRVETTKELNILTDRNYCYIYSSGRYTISIQFKRGDFRKPVRGSRNGGTRR